MSKEPNLDEALRIAQMAIMFLFSIFVFKITIGLFSGSIALIADAFNSLSDTIMIFILYLALRVIKKRPDKVFQYGYYRIEDMLSLFMSVMFFIVAGRIMLDGILAIIGGYEGSQHYEIAVITELMASMALFLFSFKQYKVAKKANITSLALSARDMRIDTLSSLFVALSIFTNKYFGLPIEGYAALLVGFLIILNAYRGFKTAMLNLLDVWKSPEIIAKIKAIINKSKYLRAGEIRLRRTGPIILGEAVVYAPEEMRIEDVDEILEEIEKEIYNTIPDLKEMLWEVEPLPENTELCAVPIKVVDGKEILAPIFEKADKFVIYELDYATKIYRAKYAINNKFSGKGSKSVKIVLAFLESGVDCVVARQIDYVTFSLLDAYEIEVYQVGDIEDVDLALKEILAKKVQPTEEFVEEQSEIKDMKATSRFMTKFGNIEESVMSVEAPLIINKEYLENNHVHKFYSASTQSHTSKHQGEMYDNVKNMGIYNTQDFEEENE